MKDISQNNETDIERTVSNLSATFLIRIIRYPLLIIYVIVIPRFLGPDIYGKLAIILSIIALVSEFFSSSFSLILAKYLPQFFVENDTAKINRIFSGTLLIHLISNCIILIILLVLYSVNLIDVSFLFFILFYFALIAENFDQLLYAYLFGLNYVGKFNLRDLFRTLFRLLYFILFYSLMGLSGLLVGLITSSISSSTYALISLKKAIKIKIVKPQKAELLNQLSFGLYVFLPTALLFFQQQIGPTILGIFSIPTEEIGFYDLSNQIYFLFYGIFISSFLVLLPISSKFEAEGSAKNERDWKITLLRMLLPIYFIIYNAFIFLSQDIITLILGNIYESVYNISRIHIFSITFWIIGQIGYIKSIASNKIKSYFSTMILSTIVYLLTALILIKNYGVYSIVVANFASALTFAILLSALVVENRKNLFIISLKIITPALILFLPVFFFSIESLLLKVGLFIVTNIIYLGWLFYSKIFIPNEFRKVKSVLAQQYKRKRKVNNVN